MINQKKTNNILKFSTYILGIAAFILAALGLMNKYSITAGGADVATGVQTLGLWKFSGSIEADVEENWKLNILGICAVVLFSLFILSYIGYAVQTQITKGKFNLFACCFVVVVIAVLIIGLCGKPYQEPKGENSITPFLNMPTGDIDQAMLTGEQMTVSIYCSYSTAGIVVVALTSILGAGSAALIATDAYKTFKAK